jgi:hypothetical protein
MVSVAAVHVGKRWFSFGRGCTEARSSVASAESIDRAGAREGKEHRRAPYVLCSSRIGHADKSKAKARLEPSGPRLRSDESDAEYEDVSDRC